MIDTIPYLKALDENSFREIVYFMQAEKYEAGQYIIRPGDKIDKIFLVIDGNLELSISINSPDLIKHKVRKKKKVHRSQTLDLKNFVELFNVEILKKLKPIPSIIPLEKDRAIIGYQERYMKGLDTNEGAPIGEYVEEITLAELGRGCILHPNLSIVRDIS